MAGMEKLAPTDAELLDSIRRRWSVRAFSSRPIEREKLRSLFEAARWAPSSWNEQPWRFVLTTRDEPDAHSKLLACLSRTNQLWAGRAYALVLGCTKLDVTVNGQPNRHAQHDLGLATENLILQAVSAGLAAHPMAGIDPEKARAAFHVPAGFDVLTAIAIGYPDDPAVLPEELRTRELAPRQRRPLEEMVFSGDWASPSPYVRGDA